MNTTERNLVMAREDYNLISEYLKKTPAVLKDHNNSCLLHKIEEAEVVDEAAFPWEVLRLNTKATIRDKQARVKYAYTVVLPEAADHKRCKVSVFSNIGSALFGYKRGDDVFWQTPKGKREFTIIAVALKTKRPIP